MTLCNVDWLPSSHPFGRLQMMMVPVKNKVAMMMLQRKIMMMMMMMMMMILTVLPLEGHS